MADIYFPSPLEQPSTRIPRVFIRPLSQRQGGKVISCYVSETPMITPQNTQLLSEFSSHCDIYVSFIDFILVSLGRGNLPIGD